jgi:hypothetical protein
MKRVETRSEATMGAVRSAELAIEPEQSRLTLEGTGIGIWEWTVDSGEVRWSGNVEQLFGLPPGKLGSTYSEFMQIVHPDDRSVLEGQRAAALAGRPGYVQVEYRVNQPDGGASWIVDRCRLLKAPVRLVGAVWNISDQKAVAAHAMKLNRLWAMTGEIHHMLTRSREPSTVFREACRIAIDKGLFRFAWVGMLEESSGGVIPAASHGYSDGYLDGLSISGRDERFGRGPTGTAIREDRKPLLRTRAARPRIGPVVHRASASRERSIATSSDIPEFG